MLGRRTPTMSFADVDGWESRIPPNSVYAQIRHWVAEHFHDADFAEWYGSVGRPSKPPTVLLALTLLQFREAVSDREAVDNAQFDDRWKFALGLSRSPDVTLVHSTLTRYRARLLDSEFGRCLVQRTLADAADAGLLGADEDLIDSFMVAGAAARRGTLALMHAALRRVLVERAAAAEAFDDWPTLERRDYAEHRKLPIDWASAEARMALLQELVHDGRALVAWGAKRSLPASMGQALAVLDLVIEQDIEPDPDHPDHVRIAQRVAADRVLSTVDPEMRHGRKSSSQKFDGYKAHVAVQNAPAGDGLLVTAVVITGGNVADGDATIPVLDDRRANTGTVPDTLMGDTAYGGMPTRHAIQAAFGDQVQLEAPVPPASNRNGRFSKTAFAIDWTVRQITCPNGHTQDIPPFTETRPKVVIHFPKATCAACPLRDQCVAGPHGRSITLDPDEPQRQVERQRQAASAWQAHYRERTRVEHANHFLTCHGGRTGRYWGKLKLTLQLQLVAAVHNIEELARCRRRQQALAPT